MTTKGKTVLMVGGASGIGLETVKLLLDQNYSLIVADKNQERLSQLPGVFINYSSDRFAVLPLDIAVPGSVRDAYRWVSNNIGKLDAVVITAAVHSAYPVEYLPDAMIDSVLNVNLGSHIKLVRDFLPLMNEGGKIIGVSSIAAQVGIPMSSLYSASKAGLEMFYESLSAELAHRGIRCSIIQPGNVNTGFNETGNDYQNQGDAALNDRYAKVVKRIHSRYGMNPESVAQVIARVLASSHPKICYVVGLNALKAHWAKRLLGRDLALRLLTQFFGFTPEKS